MLPVILIFGGQSEERFVSVASAQNLIKIADFDKLLFWSEQGELWLEDKVTLSEFKEPFTNAYQPKGVKLSQKVFDYFLNLNDERLGAEHSEGAGEVDATEVAIENKVTDKTKVTGRTEVTGRTKVTYEAADRHNQLINKKFILFLALHGGQAENGDFQKILESKQIYFTASSSLASQRAFDKKIAKQYLSGQSDLKDQYVTSSQGFGTSADTHAEVNINQLQEQGLFLAQDMTLDLTHSNWEELLISFYEKFKTQGIVIKPIASGSSYGLMFVSSAEQLTQSIVKLGKEFKGFEKFLVEQKISGRELTVGVYDNQVLPASEIVLLSKEASFDYEGKYLGKNVKEVTPALLTQDQMARAQKLALYAHQALGCYGYSRTDMILDSQGHIYYLETNTLPGLSVTSFIPQQLQAQGVTLKDFVVKQIELAKNRYSFI